MSRYEANSPLTPPNQLADLWDGTNETTDTSFTCNRGFYTAPVTNTISTEAGAVIYYTLDGTAPSAGNGLYATTSVQIVISNTIVLRAMAHMPGKLPTDIDTHSYLFVNDILAQTTNQAGCPSYWGTNESFFAADYAMGTNIVQHPAYSNLAGKALKAIPTLCITANPEDLFGPNGIYDKDTDEGYERPCSFELIYSDGRDGYQEPCSLKPHSLFLERTPQANMPNLKRSFRISFKKEYGPTKLEFPLFESAPANGASAVREFDRLVLRAGSQRNYAGRADVDQIWTTYTRDQWGRDSQLAVSGIGAHGTFVHLYLNGIYWGLYNPCERPDAWFTAAYLGGEEADWYAGKEGVTINGDTNVWMNMLAQFADTNTDWTATNTFEEIKSSLDVTNFCDYVLLWWYCGGGDWQEENTCKNVYVGARSSPTSSPMIHLCWDMELSWRVSPISTNGAWVKPTFLDESAVSTNGQLISGVFRPLWQNPEFRMLFADRLYRHCFNDGALSDENSQERWISLCDFVEDAIIAESARWGDAKAPYGTNGVEVITRNDHWYPARDLVFRYMHGNAKRFLIECRRNAIQSYPLYPMIDPPAFSQHGGPYAAEFSLSITNLGGAIYCATNGADPRAVGGAVADSAFVYSNALTLTGAVTVKARGKSGNVWSALAEAAFYPAAQGQDLRISELMYHPTGDESYENTEYEYIELENTANRTNDLSGMYFSGIGHTFPANTLAGPGERVVLASNGQAFSNRYPNVTLRGEYSGQLDNSGETITLYDSNDVAVISVAYGDSAPWPGQPDGDGYSLALVGSSTNWNNPTNWRASAWINGSPGAPDSFAEDLTNSPPAVSPSAELLYFDYANVPLRGSALDDRFAPPGASLTYAWSQVSGPGTTSFTNSAALATEASFSQAGTYTLLFTATDGVLTNGHSNLVHVVTEPATNLMVFWHRSDTGVTNIGGKVAEWQDRTDNANDALQTNTASRPGWFANIYKGAPGLYFDGTNDSLSIANSAGINTGGPYSNKMVALAFRTTENTGGRQVLYEQGGTNCGLNVYITNGYIYACAWNLTTNDGAAWGPAHVSHKAAKDMQYTLQFRHSATNLTLIVNGDDAGETNVSGVLSSSSDGIAIGGVNGSTRFHDSAIASSGSFFQGWLFDAIQFSETVDIANYLKTRESIGTACGPANSTDGGQGSGRGVQEPVADKTLSSTTPWIHMDYSWILLNDDDDNDNGIPDRLDTGATTGENDTVQFSVGVTVDSERAVPGTLKFEVSLGSQCIELWNNSTRSGSPEPQTKSWPITQSTVAETFFLEGIERSAGERSLILAAEYKCEAGSERVEKKITICTVLLEPIDLMQGYPTTVSCVNPSGIKNGGTAEFLMDLEPDPDWPNFTIKWEKSPGSAGDIEFSDPYGDEGFSAEVIGTATGEVELAVKIFGFSGPTPKIKANVVEESVVDVYAYILVRDDVTNQTAACSTDVVYAAVQRANEIFAQVAMEFEVAEIRYLTNNALFELDDDELYALFVTTNNVNGLELYFVNKYIDGVGVSITEGFPFDGIAVETHGDEGETIEPYEVGNTLGHECGHACGLDDVYVQTKSVPPVQMDVYGQSVREAWAEKDWNNGPEPAYYSSYIDDPALTQDFLIKRLLMYGTEAAVSADLPLGRIYGMPTYEYYSDSVQVDVGQFGGTTNLNRTPTH